MRYKPRWLATVAATLVLVMLTGAASASAQTPPDTEVPVTDIVFDPIQVRITKTAKTPGSVHAADSTEVCGEIHAWVQARSAVLRRVVYRYNHQVSWCWNGDKITEIEEDIDWLSHVDANFYWRGTEEHRKRYYQWGGDQKGRYYSWMQGHVENCVVKYGCIGNYYPEITINVYADGDSDYAGHA